MIFVFLKKSRGTVHEKLTWKQSAIVFPMKFVFFLYRAALSLKNSRGKVGLMAVSSRLPRDICVFKKIARHCPWKTHVERLSWWQWAAVFPVIFVFLKKSRGNVHEKLTWKQSAIVFPMKFVFFLYRAALSLKNSRGKVGLMAVSSRLPRDICVFKKIARHCPWKTHVERLAWWQWAAVMTVLELRREPPQNGLG
jgi:hypothetical protein